MRIWRSWLTRGRGRPRPKAGFRGPTLRAALFLGFGLTFGLWLFAGYYFSRRIADVEGRASEMSARYMRAQEQLSTIRAQVLMGSVLVRDALLDPRPESAGEYRQRLQDSDRTVDQALDQCFLLLDSVDARTQIAQLRREIDDFRGTLQNVLSSDGSRMSPQARDLLNQQSMPRREVVIRVSEEIQTLNRAAFIQEQAAIGDIYRVTQHRIWTSVWLALAASLGIAFAATLYAGRLERRLEGQHQTELQHTRELQRLSADLVNAQEEERRTIARELHDEVGQVLTAIKVELSVAQRSLEARGISAELLGDARTITDGALHSVRDLSHLLHPALLDDLGLPAAIEWHLRGFGKRHGLRVELLHEGMDDRIAATTEAAIYRIVQEALTNVAKHAKASTCRVYLQRLPNTVLATVEDDGGGFALNEMERRGAERGLGLIGIRERVSQLQGTLRLESDIGKGTRLTVELPASNRPAAEGGETGSPDGLMFVETGGPE